MRSIWLSFGCYWCFFLSIPIRLDFQWTFCFAVDSIWIYRYSIYLFECIEWNWLRCKWNWWFCRGSAYNLSLSLTQTYTPNIDSKQIFLYMHMREIVLLFWIIMFYFLVQYWWIWFTLLRSNSMALDRQMYIIDWYIECLLWYLFFCCCWLFATLKRCRKNWYELKKYPPHWRRTTAATKTIS